MNKVSLQDLIIQANELKKLPYGWDSYEAMPPRYKAIKNVESILTMLDRFAFSVLASGTTRLIPDINGGVSIMLCCDDNLYVDFTCFNDGEIAAVTSDKEGLIDIWEVDPDEILLSIQRINKLLEK